MTARGRIAAVAFNVLGIGLAAWLDRIHPAVGGMIASRLEAERRTACSPGPPFFGSMQTSDSLTRRQLLATGGGIAGAALLGGCFSGSNQPKIVTGRSTGFIDCHSHVWSADTERFPLGSWITKDHMKPASFTVEDLLAIARPRGVDRAVLVQHSPYFGYDPSYLLDGRRRYPGVFSIIAMIDERKPDLGVRLGQLRENGVRGIRINSMKHGDRTPVTDPPNWFKSDGMQLLWKHAQEQGVAICPLLSPELLPTLEPMCARFPDVTCVIDHFGRVGATNEDQIGSLLRLSRHAQVHVKVSAFYSMGEKKPPYDDLVGLIRRMVDAFGPRRLMWGSDCPYQLMDGNTYQDSIALVRDGLDFLTESDRRSILCDTAERVFFSR